MGLCTQSIHTTNGRSELFFMMCFFHYLQTVCQIFWKMTHFLCFQCTIVGQKLGEKILGSQECRTSSSCWWEAPLERKVVTGSRVSRGLGLRGAVECARRLPWRAAEMPDCGSFSHSPETFWKENLVKWRTLQSHVVWGFNHQNWIFNFIAPGWWV